jgi:hypothetical protein
MLTHMHTTTARTYTHTHTHTQWLCFVLFVQQTVIADLYSSNQLVSLVEVVCVCSVLRIVYLDLTLAKLVIRGLVLISRIPVVDFA